MIIRCPNCSTHYTVEAGAVGGSGRLTRCSNCNYMWTQYPVRPPPPPPPQPVYAAPPQPVYAAPPPGYAAPPGYAQAPPYAPQPGAVPQPYPPPPEQPPPMPPQPAPQVQPAPQPEPSPTPAAEPEPQPEPQPEPEAAAETEAAPEEQASEAPAPEEQAPEDQAPEEQAPEEQAPEEQAPEEMPSDEELDAMLGPPETELEAVDSLIDTGEEGETDDDGTPIDPDTIPDPEPIPESLSAPQAAEEDEEPASRGMLIVIGAAALVVILLGAGLFFGRGLIVSFWPGANDIFAMVGLSTDALGAGLDIRNVKSERETKDDVDILVVRGIVANVAEDSRMIPLIRVSLYNSSDEEVQSLVVKPTKAELKPKATVGFKARLEDPPASARRLEVTFTRSESTPDEDQGDDGEDEDE